MKLSLFRGIAAAQMTGAVRKPPLHVKYRLLPLLLIFFGATPLYADIALFLHQPHSTFGFFNPTGHAALYLSRVCAESPVHLRRCNDGEQGVVISRYNRVAGYDWIAIPIIPFLYAVDYPEQAPDYIDREGVMAVRDAWRRSNLLDIVPDAEGGAIPKGDWTQLVGAAYDRKIYGFFMETEEANDDALIEMLNGRANKRRFNLLFQNCADFAKGIINFYYPKSVRRNIIADAGITTPKQVTRSFVKFSRRNPDLRFFTFVISQVDGELGRSKAVRGVIETIIMSKKYVVPLVIASPWVAAGGVAAYLTDGIFNPEKHASMVLTPVELMEHLSAFSEGPTDEPDMVN
jgi:hypothetical protein